MKKYRVTGTLELEVEKYIEADSEEDAIEQAWDMGCKKWMDCVIGKRIVIIEVIK